MGLAQAARAIRDAGLTVTGLCRGGMFPAPDREGRRAAHDDNRRAVDEAVTLGAQCLVLVVGGLPKDRSGAVVSRDLAGAREMVRDGIGLLHEYAGSAGMRLAIEPLHPMYAADRACVNTLAQANALCDELAPAGQPNGVAAAVQSRFFFGHDQLLDCTLDDGTLVRARTNAYSGFQPGDDVKLSVRGAVLTFPRVETE